MAKSPFMWSFRSWTKRIKQMVHEWKLWKLNFLSIDFKWILLFISNNGNQLVRSLTWMLNLQKWVIVTRCWLAFLAKIKICTYSAFISDTLNILFSTLITNYVIVNNSRFLWSLTLNPGLSQKWILNFFHEFRHHFSELFLNLGLGNLTDSACLNLGLIQNWTLLFDFVLCFLNNLWLVFEIVHRYGFIESWFLDKLIFQS